MPGDLRGGRSCGGGGGAPARRARAPRLSDAGARGRAGAAQLRARNPNDRARARAERERCVDRLAVARALSADRDRATGLDSRLLIAAVERHEVPRAAAIDPDVTRSAHLRIRARQQIGLATAKGDEVAGEA